MRAAFTKYGPVHNYAGAQVTLEWDGRTLLGDVVGQHRDAVRGIWLATVRHFNGEPWPIVPALSALNILERRANA